MYPYDDIFMCVGPSGMDAFSYALHSQNLSQVAYGVQNRSPFLFILDRALAALQYLSA